MTYIYDHSKGTIISDEKPEQLKDKKTRKPGALPPGTKTIKYNTGGPVKQTPREENLNERLRDYCMSMRTDLNLNTMIIQI